MLEPKLQDARARVGGAGWAWCGEGGRGEEWHSVGRVLRAPSTSSSTCAPYRVGYHALRPPPVPGAHGGSLGHGVSAQSSGKGRLCKRSERTCPSVQSCKCKCMGSLSCGVSSGTRYATASGEKAGTGLARSNGERESEAHVAGHNGLDCWLWPPYRVSWRLGSLGVGTADAVTFSRGSQLGGRPNTAGRPVAAHRRGGTGRWKTGETAFSGSLPP